MEEKVYYWLTTPNCSHIRDIKVCPNSKASDKKNLYDSLWFNDEKEAKEFLKSLKSFLRDQYCNKYNHKDRAEWMTEEWINL